MRSNWPTVERALREAEPDACWLWPHSGTPEGYGQIWLSGRKALVHRVVCEIAHGPPPSDEHEAAHRCGTPGCVNRHHLRWATSAENKNDMLAHGTRIRGSRHYAAKLSEDQVREIRARYKPGAVRMVDLADEYGVSHATISLIVNRKLAWAWLGEAAA